MAVESIVYDPLFGVAATVLFYVAALAVHRKAPAVHPLLITCGGLIALLLIADIPYEAYRAGGDVIAFFLGPATVALGVPLYKNAAKIKRHFTAIFAGVTAGSVSAIVSAGAFSWLAGMNSDLLLSMLPKSATSPIAIELSRHLGGIPELGGVFAVLTGLVGSMVGPAFLRLFRISDDLAMGSAIGTAAHGIGTARLLRESEAAGGISGFAMGLAGIVTALLTIPIYYILQ